MKLSSVELPTSDEIRTMFARPFNSDFVLMLLRLFDVVDRTSIQELISLSLIRWLVAESGYGPPTAARIVSAMSEPIKEYAAKLYAARTAGEEEIPSTRLIVVDDHYAKLHASLVVFDIVKNEFVPSGVNFPPPMKTVICDIGLLIKSVLTEVLALRARIAGTAAYKAAQVNGD